MSLFDNLPHLVDVYGPPVVTSDAARGQVITWPTVRAEGVPCLILQGTASERNEFTQQEQQVAQHSIAFSDYDGGLEVGDKLVDVKTGRSYRFTGDRPQQGVGGIADFNIITVRELLVT